MNFKKILSLFMGLNVIGWSAITVIGCAEGKNQKNDQSNNLKNDNNKEIEKLKKQLFDSKVEITKLMQEHNKTKEVNVQITELKNELETLNHDISEKNDNILNLKEQIEKYQSEIMYLKSQYDEVNNENLSLHSKLGTGFVIENLNKELDESANKLEQLTAQVKNLVKERDEAINKTISLQNQLEINITDLTKKNQELETKIETLTTEREGFKNQIFRLINKEIIAKKHIMKLLIKFKKELKLERNKNRNEATRLQAQVETLIKERDEAIKQVKILTTERDPSKDSEVTEF